MLIAASLMSLAAAPAAAEPPKAGVLPPLNCRVATRAGGLVEAAIEPGMIKDVPAFVIRDPLTGASKLDKAVGLFSEETPGEWEYLLVREEKLVGRVRIVRQGNLRNMTFFSGQPDTEIAAAFGFCSEATLEPTRDRKEETTDFLASKNWQPGCAFVSPLQPGRIAFSRQTIMKEGGPTIVMTTPEGVPYNAKDGSRLVFSAGGTERGNTIALDRFNDGEGAGARGTAVSYADPKRRLGSQLIKLNSHAVGEGSLYGICSLSVAGAAGGVVVKD